MSNENDSFFQEVEEGVRQDRYVAFARKYGVAILGAIIVLLAAVGGWRLYQGWQVDESEKRSELLAASQKQISEGHFDDAAASLERLSKTGPGSFRAMALMERAQALEAKGDMEGALAQFDAAAEATNDQTMKNSARLRAAYLVADSQDFAALQARLQPIIADGGTMSYLARELLGVEAWEAGQTSLARDTLENLSLAFETPESVRQRVQLALRVIGPAEETPAGAPQAAPSGEPKQ